MDWKLMGIGTLWRLFLCKLVFHYYAAFLYYSNYWIRYLLFTDYCIYWIHRWLHLPLFYKYLHKPHHKWLSMSFYALLLFSCSIFFKKSSHSIRIACISPRRRLPPITTLSLFHLHFPYPPDTIPHPFRLGELLEYLRKFSVSVLLSLDFTYTFQKIHDSDMITGHIFEKVINGPAHHTLHHLYFTVNYGQVSGSRKSKRFSNTYLRIIAVLHLGRPLWGIIPSTSIRP